MREIQRADLKLRYSEYIFFSLLGGVCCFLLGYLLLKTILYALLVFPLGLLVPRVYIRWRQIYRIRLIEKQLINTLTMIANAMKAGYSFLQGMNLVANEAPYPISSEFRRTLREINLGYPMEAALDDMLERIPSADLDLAITTVKIQRSIGGNLAEILDSISQTIRERLQVRGEIRTLTAQGKMQAVILSILPPAMAVIVYLINPEFMHLFLHSTIGYTMIGLAVILQIIGTILILRIVNIRV